MTAQGAEERRRWKRASFEGAVALSTEKMLVGGKSENLSLGGLRAVVDHPLGVNASVEYQLTSSGPSGMASVRYSYPESGRHVVGLEFERILDQKEMKALTS